MTETQKRIKAYQDALPGLRERVAAVAVLLLMSLTMLVSASFAWVTLSTAPEVTGLSTTVAANGTLEIALSGPKGEVPAESAVGDSSKATGSLVKSNVTWGNLINLSDPAYGLDELVLRPAQLGYDVYNLLDQPLVGGKYGEDGRVDKLNDEFKFTSYTIPDGAAKGYFKYFDDVKYGVRAISTIHEEIPEGAAQVLYNLMDDVDAEYKSVNGAYSDFVGNKNNMSAITALITKYLDQRLNSGDNIDVTTEVKNVYPMMVSFRTQVLDPYADVLLAMSTVQVYLKYGDDYRDHWYTNVADLMNASAKDLQDRGIDMTSLQKYKNLVTAYEAAMGSKELADEKKQIAAEKGQEYKPSTLYEFYALADADEPVYWADIKPVVDQIVFITSCEMKINGKEVTVGGINRDFVTSLLGSIFGGITCDYARITQGILWDFEQLSGMKMNVTGLSVTFMGMKVSPKKVYTTACEAQPAYYEQDMEKLGSGDLGATTTKTAEDTYAMAVDLWFRTNIESSYLMLEGSLVTDGGKQVPKQGEDQSGNLVDLYSVTIDGVDENEQPFTREDTVYRDSAGIWRYADTHSTLYAEGTTPFPGQTVSEPIQLLDTVYTIIGYEGANRIWTDTDQLPLDGADSTTQGSGSCYVFYADDPAQQESSMKLLSNMFVAFVDSTPNSPSEGDLVGFAGFDTENYFASAGRVVVPMKLIDNEKSSLTKMEDGALAIYPLQKNEPVRITAILFLDAENLTNAQVDAASDMQGRLNLQFGSSELLQNANDTVLSQSTFSVTAAAKKSTESAYSTSGSKIVFTSEEAANPMQVDVRVNVTGDQPQSVKAFFMRKVNDKQGSRKETFDLVSKGNGVYEGSYTFTGPGEYVLQTVQLDGMDYELPATNYPQVSVEGFAIQNVTVSALEANQRKGTIMTDATSASTDLSLTFATNVPVQKVQLQFERDDGTPLTVNMSRNGETWTGRALFNTSGTYTLKFIVVDGEFTELDSRWQAELEIKIGLKLLIWDTKEFNNKTYGKDGFSFDIPVFLQIFDNAGNELTEMEGVKLHYSNGSQVDYWDAEMTWDASKDWYAGQFKMDEIGIYSFSQVMVGSDALTHPMQEPPTYNFLSPDPPAYYDAKPTVDLVPEGKEYYLLDDGKTETNFQMGLRLEGATTAKASVLLVNSEDNSEVWTDYIAKTGEDENIDGVLISTFKFSLPNNGQGYQTGIWSIKGLKLINVYDEDGNKHEETESADAMGPLEIDLSDAVIPTVQVVNLKVSLQGEGHEFKDKEFLESVTTTNPITITVTDHKNNPLKFNITSMSLTYHYNQDSLDKGGYTGPAGQDMLMTRQENQSTATQFVYNSLTLPYAGTYSFKSLSFALEDSGNYTVKGDGTPLTVSYASDSFKSAPIYALSTKTPTVAIAKITPTGTINCDKDGNGSGHSSVTVASPSAISATVYFSCSESDGLCGAKYHNYTQPSVTITMSNMGNATSASLSFGDAALIYDRQTENRDQSQYRSTYSWTGNGDLTRYIGHRESKSASTDAKTVAGTITATQIVLKDVAGNTYTVPLDQNKQITINNPY